MGPALSLAVMLLASVAAAAPREVSENLEDRSVHSFRLVAIVERDGETVALLQQLIDPEQASPEEILGPPREELFVVRVGDEIGRFSVHELDLEKQVLWCQRPPPEPDRRFLRRRLELRPMPPPKRPLVEPSR